ncbi:hypothetical protein EYF80_016179 [Liparis tanakae]|uniref:Uncharacterized protein n=1 Tax=Liparis tanakae TaxID=230148 RepID=A0A4Z2I8A7_9TELE|nr:hypothetical protein EYF80_016179 [Liparis tanakae]
MDVSERGRHSSSLAKRTSIRRFDGSISSSVPLLLLHHDGLKTHSEEVQLDGAALLLQQEHCTTSSYSSSYSSDSEKHKEANENKETGT